MVLTALPALAADPAVAPVPVVPPEKAVATCTVASGYALELVASEPLISEPVQIAFDPAGRLWVVEMRGFMQDSTGSTEDEPSGRISILEDTNGDGVMDKSTVFLDRLVLPRAITLVAGGAVIAEPPNLWFCRDTNGDLKCDDKQAIFRDYGKPGNPEHTANGLLWGIDNWIHNVNHQVRYRYDASGWTSAPAQSRGQWGLSQDDVGNLFYNSNSDPLRGDLLPAALATRNRRLPVPASLLNVSLEKDLAVWPNKATPGVNRGYRPDTLRKAGSKTGVVGSLAKFTAACGPCVYRGDLMPELAGNVFVAEPAANLVRREVLTSSGYAVRATNPAKTEEFINSTDERFRPVNFANGPDGALYLVDMYKGLLQHRIFLTKEYLRPYLEKRGLDQPKCGLGRIYRIVPAGLKRKAPVRPDLAQAAPAALIAHLGDAGGWWRDTAQQMLVQRQDTSVVPALRQAARTDARPLGRLHALWTLDGLGDRDPELLTHAVQDADSRVRAAALRIAEPLLATPGFKPVRLAAIPLARDASAPVRLMAAAVFGRAKDPAADAALVDLLRRDGSVPAVVDAAVSGATDREAELLGLLAQPPVEGSGTSAAITGLARALASDPATKDRLTAFQTGLPAVREAIQAGIAAAKAKKPVTPPTDQPDAAVPELDAVAQQRVKAGEERYLQLCAACHQPAGEGLAGLAPPLADSAWVTGPAGRTIRIILHGVDGPITAAGTTFQGEMPPMGGGLDDAAVADIVSYLRNAWGHRGSVVEPATVTEIRAATGARAAWKAAELETIK